MTLPAFKQQQFSDAEPGAVVRQLNGLVGALRSFFKPIVDNAALDYVQLTGVTLTTLANTVVNHKLGRAPQGWELTRINGPSTIYEVARSATTLTLYSAGTVTVDLRVW